MSLAKKAFIGFKWNALASVLSVIITIIQVYVLVRILDKSDFGVMAILSLIIAYITSFSDFGFENAIIYEKNVNHKERSSIFSLFFISGLFLFLFCNVLSYPLAYFFEKVEIQYFLWLMACTIVFNGLGRLHKILLSKEMHFKTLSIIQILCICTSFVLVVSLANYGYGIKALIYAFLFNSFLENILVFLIGYHYYPVRIMRISRFVWDKFFKLGKYEIGLKLSSMFLRKMDILVLGKNVGNDLLGGYEVVKNLMNKPHSVIPTIFTEISYPIYAKISEVKESITRLYRNQLHMIFLISAPIYIFLFVMAEEFVIFYLGDKWIDSIPLLKIFAIVFLIRSSGIPLAGLLMSLGKIRFLFYWNFFASIITVLILLGMVSGESIGVAKGLLLIQLVFILPVYILILKKHTFIKFFEYLSIMVVPTIFSIISYSLFAKILAINDLLFYLIWVMLIGTGVYLFLVFIYLKYFDQELYDLIKKYLQKPNANNTSTTS